MNVAIVGAGLAGLSLAWHLAQRSSQKVTVFEGESKGAASRIPVGLLHPFVGKEANKSWHAEEGMHEAKELVHVAEGALNQSVANTQGILRIAVTEQQQKDFHQTSEEHADAIWLSESEVLSKIEGAVQKPGLWIQDGATVFLDLYQKGLEKACLDRGVRFETKMIQTLNELSTFDVAVIAAGFLSLSFFPKLPLKKTKGHALLCRTERPLPFSLLSQGHLSPTADPYICQLGATYERNPTSLETDPSKAALLKEKIAKFYPPAQEFEEVGLKAGVRISRQEGYKPIVAKMDARTWVYTGLGSRGLLYHGFLGKLLSAAIAENRDTLTSFELHKALSV